MACLCKFWPYQPFLAVRKGKDIAGLLYAKCRKPSVGQTGPLKR